MNKFGWKMMKLSKEELVDSIAGLEQLKPVIQRQLTLINADGQGKQDAEEVGKHFDTAITSMTILAAGFDK
ncbi:MAG: hypothetical protein RSF87_12495 [Cellulosilyticaceae bacterium]